MTDLEKKVKAINDQVAIARKAVADSAGAAAVGIDPRGVWMAAANVCAGAVIKMDALHTEQLRRDLTASRNAGNAAVRNFVAKHGSRS